MRLVIFDVDGTLIDSQHHICAAMDAAFDSVGLPPLPRAEVLGIVGLSLPVAVATLTPGSPAEQQDRIVATYRQAFMAGRLVQAAPLYPGARDCLDRLAARDDILLAVATGKSRRGLAAMIEAHGLHGMFISQQTADTHPSKPAPDMLLQAMADGGIAADRAVMIGDTSFDMQMAVAAGMPGFGVSWGCHPVAALTDAGAALVATDFAALTAAIEDWAA